MTHRHRIATYLTTEQVKILDDVGEIFGESRSAVLRHLLMTKAYELGIIGKLVLDFMEDRHK